LAGWHSFYRIILFARAEEHWDNLSNTLVTLLNWRVIPIINKNDTVTTEEIKVCDNDARARGGGPIVADYSGERGRRFIHRSVNREWKSKR
jgi:hypothetical protein